MRHAMLFVPLLAATAAAPVFADGLVRFTGEVREATCPMVDGRVTCARPVGLAWRRLDASSLPAVALWRYALARAPAVRWRVVETTYR